jgi:UDP-N-acetylglucosamine--N-acetylmuramyl-(pentapeptide) pyrophosphoryl-undecaprenol N-acetylglucosamine transferase
LSLRLIIAGGGTGGHVFPGIALAEAFLRACPRGAVSFVGTENGLEARAVPAKGFEIDFVPSGQVLGKGAAGAVGLVRIMTGTATAFKVVRRRRPDLVFGVGGYASVPVSLAAAALRVPLFLQEQNAVPGRANRWLGRLSRRVYAGFPGAVRYFPRGRAVVTGNPVREDIVAAAGAAGAADTGSPFTVFALGGSQGARAINRLVLSIGRRAKAEGLPLRFLLQAGPLDFASVEKEIRAEGLPVEAFPFADRIWEFFSRCGAVVMRAGAVSIAEVALFGRPCLLIPYPHAADRHQEKNAREFCGAGAGVWMLQEDADAGRVLATLTAWAEDPGYRKSAGEAARAFSRPSAAADIVRSALREIGKAEAVSRV